MRFGDGVKNGSMPKIVRGAKVIFGIDPFLTPSPNRIKPSKTICFSTHLVPKIAIIFCFDDF